MLTLPYSKERWTTTACLTSTKNIIVGERNGTVHVFNLGIPYPIQTLKKVHSHLGVTDITTDGDAVFSMGKIIRYDL